MFLLHQIVILTEQWFLFLFFCFANQRRKIRKKLYCPYLLSIQSHTLSYVFMNYSLRSTKFPKKSVSTQTLFSFSISLHRLKLSEYTTELLRFSFIKSICWNCFILDLMPYSKWVRMWTIQGIKKEKHTKQTNILAQTVIMNF